MALSHRKARTGATPSIAGAPARRQEWPEGSAADPDAARARYEHDMRETRGAARQALRAELPHAHLGLGLMTLVAVAVGYFKGIRFGAVVPAAFLALFCAMLAGRFATGARGRDLLRRSYLLTFGWAQWF
ncbi:hypothetical protein OG689_31795 [Kitasatospora sp. NBC_00240]|uniref:hypothetical protein n=1 Tax=Kitasatospora sp. NBC_00240 TaxID=2903567 RepID=UPI00225B4BFF|nr:hypothetical protein [Kitasatospora sp. NBC_00240]MCX5213800.1 hypothetical protein [Kitasatospora sp. NBC_00240]